MADFGDDDALIVAARRSPIGRAVKGSLSSVRPDDLLLSTVLATFGDVPALDPTLLEDFYAGAANPEHEHGQNIARRVAVMAGLDSLPGASVNRFCASSLQAARMAFHAIRAGEGDAFLVGGVECVSRYPIIDEAPNPVFESARLRQTQLFDSQSEWVDPRTLGLLPDAYIAMGRTAEFVARTTSTTRIQQDEWALVSQTRAVAAVDAGAFDGEIAPVALGDGTVVRLDDGPRRGTTLDVLGGLRPAFHPEGTVTAGNSSPLNDGSSAAIVVSGRFARRHDLTPLARIVASSASALSPEVMGLGPVDATRRVLDRSGLTISDLDVVELNEAFAAQVVPSVRMLALDPERLNPTGGAIALGHPFGSTGVRMLVTLVHGMAARDETLGLATLCVGGGQGMAMVVERL